MAKDRVPSVYSFSYHDLDASSSFASCKHACPPSVQLVRLVELANVKPTEVSSESPYLGAGFLEVF
eukprot:8863478-Pyramimonas_sp.AAC.1